MPPFSPHFEPYLEWGVANAKGPRRRMEDAHSIVVPFGKVPGQGLFAVFDGHCGKRAAEWCGEHFPQYLESAMEVDRKYGIPEALKEAFHKADASIQELHKKTLGPVRSGCTAVVALVLLEPRDQSDSEGQSRFTSTAPAVPRSLFAKRRSDPRRSDPAAVRRVLYTANAGDSRAVLCRGGKAVRLTRDHKASDPDEANRIESRGGTVLAGRVDGKLAPSRGLGDHHLRTDVESAPFVARTEIGDDDEFLILACDGLWDVIDDEEAVDLVRDFDDPEDAAKELLKDAYLRESGDNVTIIVVRFREVPPDDILFDALEDEDPYEIDAAHRDDVETWDWATEALSPDAIGSDTESVEQHPKRHRSASEDLEERAAAGGSPGKKRKSRGKSARRLLKSMLSASI
ncbi:protein serine/threonine phosphatase 2C [Trametes cingulata]|nr:protein serine/threonine phosphatase 2C [Trametes cingulata]